MLTQANVLGTVSNLLVGLNTRSPLSQKKIIFTAPQRSLTYPILQCSASLSGPRHPLLQSPTVLQHPPTKRSQFWGRPAGVSS